MSFDKPPTPKNNAIKGKSARNGKKKLDFGDDVFGSNSETKNIFNEASNNYESSSVSEYKA